MSRTRVSQPQWLCRGGLALTTFLVNAHLAWSTELSSIHSVAVVSILGHIVDMQTPGITKFDYSDYKLHTDWTLDDLARDYIGRALAAHFSVRNDAVDAREFSGLEAKGFQTAWGNISDRLRSLPRKPDVDAIVVVYPNATDSTGYVSPGLGVTYDVPFLFHDAKTTIAVSYAVGLFDVKTGDRIDFGTGRYPASGYITGYSPAWESCSKSMWAESEDSLTGEQRTRIRHELWSLLSRSLPYAMASAGLISASEATSVSVSSAVSGDPSCHGI